MISKIHPHRYNCFNQHLHEQLKHCSTSITSLNDYHLLCKCKEPTAKWISIWKIMSRLYNTYSNSTKFLFKLICLFAEKKNFYLYAAYADYCCVAYTYILLTLYIFILQMTTKLEHLMRSLTLHIATHKCIYRSRWLNFGLRLQCQCFQVCCYIQCHVVLLKSSSQFRSGKCCFHQCTWEHTSILADFYRKRFVQVLFCKQVISDFINRKRKRSLQYVRANTRRTIIRIANICRRCQKLRDTQWQSSVSRDRHKIDMWSMTISLWSSHFPHDSETGERMSAG